MATKQTGDGIRQSIYFYPDAFQKANQLAASEGLSRSQLVNKVIAHYADRNNGKKYL